MSSKPNVARKNFNHDHLAGRRLQRNDPYKWRADYLKNNEILRFNRSRKFDIF